MSECKVSIVVPIYNAEKYIDKCIESILQQDYYNLEIILINDGSTDKSAEICTQLEEKDTRIKLYNKKNAGVSSARNFGIAKATGEYLMFADADDSLSRDCVKKLIEHITEKKVDLVCCAYQMQKSKNRTENVVYQDTIIADKILEKKIINVFKEVANAPWGKLFRMDIIKNNNIQFPVDVPYGEDTIFLFDYCTYIDSLAICSDIIYYYNCANISSAMNKIYEDMYRYLYKIYEQKKQFFVKRKNEQSFKSVELVEAEYYFEWCVSHYLYNMKLGKASVLIEMAANVFANLENSERYKFYYESKKWDVFTKKRFRDQLFNIIVYKIKKYYGKKY